MYITSSYYNETDAEEWVENTFRHFPNATYYYTTYPRNEWHAGALWYTLKIGDVVVVIASYYEDGIWGIYKEEDYPNHLLITAEGIFDCEYADMNHEFWDEFVEAVEKYSEMEGDL